MLVTYIGHLKKTQHRVFVCVCVEYVFLTHMCLVFYKELGAQTQVFMLAQQIGLLTKPSLYPQLWIFES